MEKHIEALGHRFKDTITSLEGVCDCVCFDLYGCVQYLIRKTKLDKDGNIDGGKWLDSTRLKRISKNRLMEVPNIYKFKKEEPKTSTPAGPADKPSR